MIDYTAFITEILQEVSGIAVQNFGKVSSASVKSNDNNQVLTETDIEIGNYIVSAIKNLFE